MRDSQRYSSLLRRYRRFRMLTNAPQLIVMDRRVGTAVNLACLSTVTRTALCLLTFWAVQYASQFIVPRHAPIHSQAWNPDFLSVRPLQSAPSSLGADRSAVGKVVSTYLVFVAHRPLDFSSSCLLVPAAWSYFSLVQPTHSHAGTDNLPFFLRQSVHLRLHLRRRPLLSHS